MSFLLKKAKYFCDCQEVMSEPMFLLLVGGGAILSDSPERPARGFDAPQVLFPLSWASPYQERKTEPALEALRDFLSPWLWS